MTDHHGLGAQRTPTEILAGAWPIGLALAAAPLPVPAKFHSPLCDVHATLDQNGYGACVCASGDYIQTDLDAIAPNSLAWLRLYAILKGLPYPFTPAQDTNPGLNPPQLWAYTKANGWPTADGSAPHKDASYLLLGKPSAATAFQNAYQQTLLQIGPCQFTATWPSNWYRTDSNGYMAAPPAAIGTDGHAFEACGWVPCATCGIDTIHHQSWGSWGQDPEFPNHFRVHSTAWDRLGWEAWKVVDGIEVPMDFIPSAPTATCDLTAGSGRAYASTAAPAITFSDHKGATLVGSQSRGEDGVKGYWVVVSSGPIWVGADHVANIVAPGGGGDTVHSVAIAVDGAINPATTIKV